MKSTIIIGGIEYAFDGQALEYAVEIARKEYRNKSNRNGTFWDDVRDKTGGKYGGLAVSTIKGWYHNHIPRNPDDLVCYPSSRHLKYQKVFGF
ncbi:MAG: hypothetical protein IJ419_10250 [Agathobacter sp.]|nr:hypothetical protein [Agathobacter sp.]